MASTPSTAPSVPSGTAAPARRAGLLSVAGHLPSGVLSNADFEAMVETSDTWILERTGIRHRRRGGPGETTSEIGARAAAEALDRAGNPKVDALVVATSSPETLFPSASCLIQRRLGLVGVPSFDVGAACSGFIYASIAAEGLIASGVAERVLVVAAESMTSLVDYGDRSTCVLFGDGAGAAVYGRVDEGGIVGRRWGADGRESDLIYYGPPDGAPEGEPHIRMAGKGTYRLAVDRLCAMCVDLCVDARWSPDDVDLFVPHQANLRIIEAAAKRLGVPMDRVMVNVDETGNTSAASIPLALADAQRQGRLKAGMRVVCVAFGAGATWGGLALEWPG